MASTEKLITVRAGDRIDILAWRHLGDAARYSEILALNPFLDIWSPQIGITIRIPHA